MRRERRTEARQRNIDRANAWRVRRDRARIKTTQLAMLVDEVVPMPLARFEAILCAKTVPTAEEVAAIEAVLADLERRPS